MIPSVSFLRCCCVSSPNSKNSYEKAPVYFSFSFFSIVLLLRFLWADKSIVYSVGKKFCQLWKRLSRQNKRSDDHYTPYRCDDRNDECDDYTAGNKRIYYF